MKKNILNNTFAAAGSIFWSVVIQLISVPLLISYWGVDKYGVWLMLIAIPTYISLSDFGISVVATSAMSMEYAKNNIERLNSIFQSVVLFLMSVLGGVFVLCSVIACVYFYYLSEGRDTDGLIFTVVILVFYSIVSIFSTVILACFRSANKYAFGTIVYDALQFVEGVSVVFVAFLGFGYIGAAVSLCVSRLLILVVMIVLVRKKLPIYIFGYKSAAWIEIKKLLKPALGALVIPLSLALNIQGMIMIAGALISPAAVAVLGPTRTISRIAIQAVGIVNRATIPEFSRFYANRNISELYKLLRFNLLAMIFLLIPGAVGFAVYGAQAIELWSGGKISPDFEFLSLMAIAMVIHGFWFFGFNIFLSINRHADMSVYILLGSVFGLIVAIVFSGKFGLNGVAVALVLSEFIAFAVVGLKGIKFFKDAKISYFLR